MKILRKRDSLSNGRGKTDMDSGLTKLKAAYKFDFINGS